MIYGSGHRCRTAARSGNFAGAQKKTNLLGVIRGLTRASGQDDIHAAKSIIERLNLLVTLHNSNLYSGSLLDTRVKPAYDMSGLIV